MRLGSDKSKQELASCYIVILATRKLD